MRRWWLLAILTILLAAAPRAALACSCAQATKAQQAANVAVVFTGTVTNVSRVFSIGNLCSMSSADPVSVGFQVDSVYKGDLPTTVAVRTAVSGASCGYEFVAGKRYTVFATFGDSSLETGLCRGNTEGTIDPTVYGLPASHPPRT